MKEKLPKEFLEDMKEILKDEFEDFLKKYEEKPIRSFKINNIKTTNENFLEIFDKKIEKIPYAPNGYYLKDEMKVGFDPLHHSGSYYMQEPSAMTVTNSVTIPKDSIVLDVCSAPGGKSIGISNQLLGSGFLVSNEINPTRAKILLSNIERMGITNCMVTNFNVNQLKELYPNTFDYIFLDTPCSGEGMFRKDEQAIQEWSKENVDLCAKRSLELLETIESCLKKDGYLVYSTCTFAKEENEEVIEKFLKKHHYELIELPDNIQKVTKEGIKTTENTTLTRRFYPHTGNGEGQFIAVLKKKEETNEKENWKSAIQKLTNQQEKIVLSFLKETLTNIDFEIYKYKEQIILLPKTPIPFPSHHVLSLGVTLGTIEKNRIVPHHQFFSAYGKHFKNKLNLKQNDSRIQKYLEGQEIESEQINDGWGCLLIEESPVGGFKAKNQKLKNHYPKGLRNFSN